MMMDIVLVTIGLLALLIASLFDIKTREVSDWISYSLIFSGIMLRLMYAGTYGQWSYFYGGLIGFGLMFILGHLMFYTKQWGGGDAKLMMGVGVVFATQPYFVGNHPFPFLALVLLNIAVVGALYGIIYGICLAITYRKKFVVSFKRLNKEKSVAKFKVAALVFAGMTMIVVMLSNDIRLKTMASTGALFILIYPYLSIFIKSIEKSCLLKKIPVTSLTPGDWVEQDVVKNKKIVYKRKLLGIEKKDIEKLIKAKANAVLVKEGIPFIPPFFLGALITVISGKIIFIF